MRSSGLAVLSVLCAVAAVLLPDPAILLQVLRSVAREGGGGGGEGGAKGGGPALPPLHPSLASWAAGGEGEGRGGQGCPLGFGLPSSLTLGGRGTNGAVAAAITDDATAPRRRVLRPEQRTWYVGAGGGWTGAEDAEEGPLWLEPGGGFAVDGTGDVAEVAATEAEARAAVFRDAAEGRLAGGVVPLMGAHVIPGIVDAHVHLIPAGLALTSHADLRAVASRGEFEAAVGSAARRLLLLLQASAGEGGLDCGGGGGRGGDSDGEQQPPLPWLMGGWWDESQWPGAEMPTASWVDGALERAAAEAEEARGGDAAAAGSAAAGSAAAAAAAAAEARCLRALPVLLSRMDGHMGVANRAALRLARAALRRGERGHEQEGGGGGAVAEGARELLASADEPAANGNNSNNSDNNNNRFVDLDPDTGATTGLVREAGLLAVARAAPPPTLAARRAALEAAAQRLLSVGVTAAGDMGRSPFAGGDPSASWGDLEELYDPAAAAEEGADDAVASPGAAAGGGGPGGGGANGGGGGASPYALPVRIAAYLPLETWPRLAARVAARGAVTGLLHAAGVKTFWDGSLGSRTALMTEPYEVGEGQGAGGEGGSSGGGGADKSGHNNNSNHNRGVRMVDSPDATALAMRRADAAGLQPAVHAIGDAAVDEATAALATVAEAREAAAAAAASASSAAAGPTLPLPQPVRVCAPNSRHMPIARLGP